MANTHGRWFVLLACLATAAACDSNGGTNDAGDTLPDAIDGRDDTSGPVPPPPIVRFEPVDLATAFGTTPPEARITWTRSAPPRESFDALAASVTLVTWPELDAVPMTVAVEMDYLPDTSRIVFTPTSALSERWYALRISSLPAPFTWPYYEYHFLLPDGAKGIRFRPDSRPIFWGLRVCDRTTEYSANVWFSEPILAERPVAEVVAITQPEAPEVRCEVLPMPDMATGEVNLRCPGFDPSRPFRLDIATGLTSPSGVPVTDLAENPTPLSYVLSWDTLPPTIPECHILRP